MSARRSYTVPLCAKLVRIVLSSCSLKSARMNASIPIRMLAGKCDRAVIMKNGTPRSTCCFHSGYAEPRLFRFCSARRICFLNVSAPSSSPYCR